MRGKNTSESGKERSILHPGANSTLGDKSAFRLPIKYATISNDDISYTRYFISPNMGWGTKREYGEEVQYSFNATIKRSQPPMTASIVRVSLEKRGLFMEKAKKKKMRM